MNEASSPRIHLLPPTLANQIAAGEIVERPASVLKELLENALDAGAKRIEIESEAGGIGLIRVHDDGCGIHQDDLHLALSSHATSKFRQQEELLSITTLGFRGEALASIGAVSHLSLSSRVPDTKHGWCIQENAPAQPVAHPVGTTIEVRDLFYNTPARRRFLRGEKTEFMHLRTVLERLALSHFQVRFRLRHNRHPVLTLPACPRPAERIKRVTQICGRNFTQQSLYFERETEGLHLWGWLGLPGFSRSQTDLQYCYVNNRMVRDKLLSHAARQAYGERLHQGRHPAYLLYLELPAHQVDVNAHPAKHEVRFREARQIHGFIVRTLIEVLDQAELEGDLWSAQSHPQPPTHNLVSPPQSPRLHTIAESTRSYQPPIPHKIPAPSRNHKGNSSPPLGQARALVLGRYILAENGKGLVLVDFPAARASLAQARLRAAYGTGRITRQPLLLPLTLNVSSKQAAKVEQHASKLLELGFGLHRLGPEVLVLREIPAPLRELNLEGLLHAFLTELIEANQEGLALTSLEKIVIKLTGQYPAATLPRLSLQEMNTLLRELEHFSQDRGHTGDKLPWRELQSNEIEKWFASN